MSINHQLLLFEELQSLNRDLRAKDATVPEQNELRKLLEEAGAVFANITDYPLPKKNFNFSAVDGSFVSMGIDPNSLYLFSALAKNFKNEKESVYKIKIHSNNDPDDTETKPRILPALELNTTLKYLENFPHPNANLLFFDGGFSRYQRHSSDEFRKLKQYVLNTNITIIGVIEEIQSKLISKILKLENDFTDKYLLAGLLKPGEFLYFPEHRKDNFFTVFCRFSNDINPVAFDFLPEQTENFIDILNFANLLTPKAGRGIPIFIDVVDHEVKIKQNISSELVKATFELRPQLVLLPKRSQR